MPDGATYRDHLDQVARITRKTPPELTPPELPPGTETLMEIYLALDSGRGNNGWGLSPITWQDLMAWQQCHGISLDGWEAQTLLAMDKAVLAAKAEN